MGLGAGSDHTSQEKTTRPAPFTGGYYWLPAPGHPTISWDVVTCHQFGFDAEVGHVEMWTAVIDQLATAWRRIGRVSGEKSLEIARQFRVRRQRPDPPRQRFALP